jgi:hypothetical protein
MKSRLSGWEASQAPGIASEIGSHLLISSSLNTICCGVNLDGIRVLSQDIDSLSMADWIEPVKNAGQGF